MATLQSKAEIGLDDDGLMVAHQDLVDSGDEDVSVVSDNSDRIHEQPSSLRSTAGGNNEKDNVPSDSETLPTASERSFLPSDLENPEDSVDKQSQQKKYFTPPPPPLSSPPPVLPGEASTEIERVTANGVFLDYDDDEMVTTEPLENHRPVDNTADEAPKQPLRWRQPRRDSKDHIATKDGGSSSRRKSFNRTRSRSRGAGEEEDGESRKALRRRSRSIGTVDIAELGLDGGGGGGKSRSRQRSRSRGPGDVDGKGGGEKMRGRRARSKGPGDYVDHSNGGGSGGKHGRSSRHRSRSRGPGDLEKQNEKLGKSFRRARSRSRGPGDIPDKHQSKKNSDLISRRRSRSTGPGDIEARIDDSSKGSRRRSHSIGGGDPEEENKEASKPPRRGVKQEATRRGRKPPPTTSPGMGWSRKSRSSSKSNLMEKSENTAADGSGSKALRRKLSKRDVHHQHLRHHRNSKKNLKVEDDSSDSAPNSTRSMGNVQQELLQICGKVKPSSFRRSGSSTSKKPRSGRGKTSDALDSLPFDTDTTTSSSTNKFMSDMSKSMCKPQMYYDDDGEGTTFKQMSKSFSILQTSGHEAEKPSMLPPNEDESKSIAESSDEENELSEVDIEEELDLEELLAEEMDIVGSPVAEADGRGRSLTKSLRVERTCIDNGSKSKKKGRSANSLSPTKHALDRLNNLGSLDALLSSTPRLPTNLAEPSIASSPPQSPRGDSHSIDAKTNAVKAIEESDENDSASALFEANFSATTIDNNGFEQVAADENEDSKDYKKEGAFASLFGSNFSQSNTGQANFGSLGALNRKSSLVSASSSAAVSDSEGPFLQLELPGSTNANDDASIQIAQRKTHRLSEKPKILRSSQFDNSLAKCDESESSSSEEEEDQDGDDDIAGDQSQFNAVFDEEDYDQGYGELLEEEEYDESVVSLNSADSKQEIDDVSENDGFYDKFGTKQEGENAISDQALEDDSNDEGESMIDTTSPHVKVFRGFFGDNAADEGQYQDYVQLDLTSMGVPPNSTPAIVEPLTKPEAPKEAPPPSPKAKVPGLQMNLNFSRLMQSNRDASNNSRKANTGLSMNFPTLFKSSNR